MPDATSHISSRYLPILVSAVVALCILPAHTGHARWHHHKHARLLRHPFNDGDSFHVLCGRKHYIFRLYFVDAPETDDAFPKRVKAQADYWDLTPKQTLALGRAAADFTRTFLAKPFTVHTCYEDAHGRSDRPRHFAMIETADGFLSTALVRHGLARIYGKPTKLPDGKRASHYWATLHAIEKEARDHAAGGWGWNGITFPSASQ